MSDQERVAAWMDDFRDWLPPEMSEAELADIATLLGDSFAAVRLEERRRIVSWIRGLARDGRRLEPLPLADKIERGDHEANS
jgi:hypothetical protein